MWGLLLFFIFYFIFIFPQLTRHDVPPCVYLPLFPYLIWLLSPLSHPLNCISLCGALVVFVLVFLAGLSCAAYMVAFLALRVLYVVVLVLFRSCFLAFPPESFPGDDVLCRLLSCSLPSVCFLPCLFVLFCFVFSDRLFTICFGLTSSILWPLLDP